MNVTNDQLTIGTSYEEVFLGCDILIEHNPDRWRDGFVWSVYKNGEEIDSDLDFGLNEAINAARRKIKLNLNT
jgi:hypothetical protein